MKFFVLLFSLCCLLGATAQAQFETWTNKDGKEATLKLLEVVKDGDKTKDVLEKLRHKVAAFPTVIVLDAKGKMISIDRNIPNLEKILLN